jgi:hypothetical protein
MLTTYTVTTYPYIRTDANHSSRWVEEALKRVSRRVLKMIVHMIVAAFDYCFAHDRTLE